MAFQIGQVIGEYQIVRVLGHGGLGAVYEATHLISRRSEAMKVMLSQQAGSPEAAERFRREIQLLAALDHPNISALHNAFYFDNELIMMMELVQGEDLRSLSRSGPVDLTVVLGFAEQVLLALQYAHSRSVVHRDIKPANLMITPSGVVKVLDFGIAISGGSADLTLAGALIGSPTHMSPEQIRGEKAIPQSDIYSFGVTLYELLAGHPPIQGATTYALMMAHLNQVPAPLHSIRPDLPPHISEAIARALEKDATKRFPSASAFLAALRPEATPHPDEMQTITPPAPLQPITAGDLNKPMTGSSTLPLEAVIRHLASFIGPIAKIVVPRLAKTCTSTDQLYSEAAKQIENDADRQRFLRTRPRE